MKNFINKIKMRFKPVFYTEFNGREFYIKRNLFWSKHTVYFKNIRIYDRSGNDNHEWEFLPICWYPQEPYYDCFMFFLENQRPEFFEYKIKEYI